MKNKKRALELIHFFHHYILANGCLHFLQADTSAAYFAKVITGSVPSGLTHSEAIHLHRYSWGGYSRVSYSGIFLDIDFLLLYMYSKLVKKPQTWVLATQFGPTTV